MSSHEKEGGGEDSKQTETETVGREGEGEVECEGQRKGCVRRVREDGDKEEPQGPPEDSPPRAGRDRGGGADSGSLFIRKIVWFL